MNRRLAIGKMLAGFVATTTVSAKDFDPTIGREDMVEDLNLSDSNRQEESIAYIWQLQDKMPARIKSGFRWLRRCEESSLLDLMDDHSARDILPAILPRWAYRALVRFSYYRRLDACRPDLTDDEWEQCRTLFEAYKKIDDGSSFGFEMIQKCMTGILR